MRPAALLDLATELLRRVLQLQHPADRVVSAFFREHRQLGARAELGPVEAERARPAPAEEIVEQPLDLLIEALRGGLLGFLDGNLFFLGHHGASTLGVRVNLGSESATAQSGARPRSAAIRCIP